MTEHKYVSFEETFEVPNDAKLEDASGMFEDGQIYCIAIPKVKGIAITMPPRDQNISPKPRSKKEGASIHRYNEGEKAVPRRESPKDYLKNITGEPSNKKVAYFVAILLALVIIMVVLIVKLRRS